MNASHAAKLLQESIGLDITSVGLGVIRTAMQHRIRATGSDNEDTYLGLLQASPAEMAALVEEVVVPETWFFRHEEAFRLMSQYICGEWRSKYPQRVANILSIPCSTGEEAYSIAMALMDHGLNPKQFSIDAIDVSRQALDRAKRAIYGNNSFRNGNQNFRQHFFTRTEAGYELKQEVRQSVRFHQGNILDHALMETLPSYDIIFCRNLLIYLDHKSRMRVVDMLAKKLNKEGLLFVGHAETGLIWRDRFDSVVHPMAFAYRHRSSPQPHASKSGKRPLPVNRPGRLPVRATSKHINRQKLPIRPKQATANKRVMTQPKHESGPSLESVSRLANRGHLEEARQQCEAYLQQNGASAQAYFLLGLISDIQSNKENARNFFRKALYLEPDHYETLIHLALLLDQTGEHKAAERLRTRVQRLSENEHSRAKL